MMRVRSGPRGLPIVLGAVALVAAACSSGSGVTVAQGRSADPAPDATVDFGAVVRDGEFCRLALENTNASAYPLDPDLTVAELEQLMDDLVDAAPDPIRDDVALVRELALASAGIEGYDPPFVKGDATSFDDAVERISAAQNRLEAFLTEECGFTGPTGASAEGGDDGASLPAATADGATHLGGGTDAMPETFGDDPVLDGLWTACGDGDFAACDELYATSPLGSDYEAFALECGGRSADQYGTCELELGDGAPADDVQVSGPSEPGDDGGFDVLYEACGAGVLDACDDLYIATPIGSGYEAYGSTCGETTDEQYGGCTELLGGDDGLDYESDQPGDDPGNDLLYQACQDDNMAACDVLYVNAGFGSEYERMALSCGERRDHVGASPDCARSF